MWLQKICKNISGECQWQNATLLLMLIQKRLFSRINSEQQKSNFKFSWLTKEKRLIFTDPCIQRYRTLLKCVPKATTKIMTTWKNGLPNATMVLLNAVHSFLPAAGPLAAICWCFCITTFRKAWKQVFVIHIYPQWAADGATDGGSHYLMQAAKNTSKPVASSCAANFLFHHHRRWPWCCDAI